MNGMRTGRRFVKALVFALFVALIFSNVSYAQADNGGRQEVTPPQIKKVLKTNEDGTYTLSLSVTGRASTSTEHNKADVIVVLDRSGSMDYDQAGHSPDSWFYSGPSRMTVAKTAVNQLGEQLLANNTSDNPDMVRLSLVSFSNLASSDISGTSSLRDFQGKVNAIRPGGGTNWEDALQVANAIETRPGADVYIIFVSDGNPTFRNTRDGNSGTAEDARHGTNPYYYGSGNSDNNGKNFKWTVVRAKEIVDAGKKFYTIGAFGDATKMQQLATQAGAPALNYYNATDQTALNAAFANIINEITNALGYTDVAINDGLTELTSTMLVAGDADGFTYTKSGGSYGEGAAWTDAPAASYNGTAVSWDLGDMILENGVTYTVNFTVWPKQEAYDLVADLNNGLITYDSLTEDQQKQIVQTAGGGYGLRTNSDSEISYTQIETTTTALLPDGATENPDGTYSYNGFTYAKNDDGTWTGTKETEGSGSFTNPEPIALTNDNISLKKEWNDSLDPSLRPASVTLRVKRDDNKYVDVELNEENGWSKEINVAPGIKVGNEVLETGHDYTVIEVDQDHHFELISETFHPMIVDGELLKSDSASGADASVVIAKNELKGNLDIKKNVISANGVTAPSDAIFKMTVTLNKQDGSAWDAGNYNGTVDDADTSYLKYYIHHADGSESDKMMIKSGDVIELKAGEYARIISIPAGSTYDIAEKAEDMPAGFTLDSSQGTSGTFASNKNETAEFTNKYAVSETTVSIPVKKVLSTVDGLTPPDITEAYTFKLTADEGTPLPEVTELKNPDADGGVVTFGDITYSKPGTYTYTVTESGSVAGITNDETADKTVTVTVSDNGDGTLSAEASADDNSPLTFINTYSVEPTKAVITAQKVFRNADISQASFNFVLSAAEGTPMPLSPNAVNDAYGEITFGEIIYSKPGSYIYTIKETAGTADYVEYDTSTYEAIVDVKDNSDGTLTATVNTGDEIPTFINAYIASNGGVYINATKYVNGLAAADNIFEFTITADDGGNLPAQTTVTNNGGSVEFGPITYDASIFEPSPLKMTEARSKTYHYTISETVGDAAGYTYDINKVGVSVTVSDNGDGTLATEVSYDTAPEFHNSYASSGTAVIEANKVLKGRNLENGQFTFALYEGSEEVAVATNDADGAIKFEVAYNQATVGNHVYTMREVVDEPSAGYNYDSTAKTIDVAAIDNGDGTITTEVSYQDDMTFTNVYKPLPTDVSLGAKKILTGRELVDGEFTFQIRTADGSGGASATNDADGQVKFPAIPITEAGTYEFIVTEENGGAEGIKYDDSEHVYTVTVEDIGGKLTVTSVTVDGSQDIATFKNEFVKKPIPTWDAADSMMWLFLAIVATTGLIGMTGYRRKRI